MRDVRTDLDDQRAHPTCRVCPLWLLNERGVALGTVLYRRECAVTGW